MLRGYRYRLYPTKRQKELFEQHFGCTRAVYNMALELKITSYKTFGKSLSQIDICNQLPDLKKGFSWFAEVDSQSLQAAVRKVDAAYKNFFNGNGFPKFKKKQGTQSFQCPNNTRKINWEKKTLDLPKVKGVPIVFDRMFSGLIKTVTITKTPTGKYFASILVNDSKELPEKKRITEPGAIGIDLGLKHFAVTSTGEKFDNPKHLYNLLARMKCLQRRALRKQRRSMNRKKASLRVALVHERVADSRKDFLHKLSTQIVRQSQTDTICMENLTVKNLVRNHKLAQAITDVSWSEFVRQMKYKCAWSGKNFIQIDKFAPSSKMCSCCGHINDELTLADREWTCAECHVTHDRDINAAMNIKFMGLTRTGAGATQRYSGKVIPEEPAELLRLRRAKKQEYVSV